MPKTIIVLDLEPDQLKTLKDILTVTMSEDDKINNACEEILKQIQEATRKEAI
jgi:predicted DNA-binding ArsR family transcriptional regulator